jgi:gluconate 2-dehydrogenase gamma chain
MSTPAHHSPTVRSLLVTDAVTPATAKALSERLQQQETPPRFFDSREYHLISVVCDILLDQSAENRLVPVATFIDERLADGRSGGWRFDHMPPDPEMYRQGLRGIDETACVLFSQDFVTLAKEKQRAVLLALQTGSATGMIWQQMSPTTFFEELLAEATEVFYAHPLAQEEINYLGMADAHGWQKIGLNDTEEKGL